MGIPGGPLRELAHARGAEVRHAARRGRSRTGALVDSTEHRHGREPEMPKEKEAGSAAGALTGTSTEVWQRWSEDRERRQIQRRVNAEMEAPEAANLPIYPRECAARIAEETMRTARFRPRENLFGRAWAPSSLRWPPETRDDSRHVGCTAFDGRRSHVYQDRPAR